MKRVILSFFAFATLLQSQAHAKTIRVAKDPYWPDLKVAISDHWPDCRIKFDPHWADVTIIEDQYWPDIKVKEDNYWPDFRVKYDPHWPDVVVTGTTDLVMAAAACPQAQRMKEGSTKND